ncbi:ParA family protein [Nostoc sp. UIC 10630]|uniref:ParA family protein n=1 Tax=Nostoc sp. UIC 10630 TaxID=2100146 RepID=UPI0013D11D1A|nr:ParA family protein [Nostoc sp. UIC 10630]NEU80981.1 ParA family protein [Nostoc sp. UIC 10630]
MPIISLSSFKGGVSKTTSAICLASLFCDDGATLVIDADPNRSATTWARPGGLPFQVCGEKEAAKLMRTQKFEFIIFDTPARPNDAEVEDLARGCDLLIVPTPPDLLGMDAMALMAKSLPPETNWKVLLTMIPPPPQRDGEEAMSALLTQGYPVLSRGIRFYKAYKDAVTNGVPVYKVRGGKVAWRDWTEIKNEVIQAIKG